MNERDERQAAAYQWVRDTFGEANTCLPERVLRLFEETVELAQAEGLHPGLLQAVISHVYSKPAGEPVQEVGGVGTTLLAYCAAKNISADACEATELQRVMSMDAEHFRKRHDLKADAGVALRRRSER